MNSRADGQPSASIREKLDSANLRDALHIATSLLRLCLKEKWQQYVHHKYKKEELLAHDRYWKQSLICWYRSKLLTGEVARQNS